MDDRHRLERVVDAVLPVRQRILDGEHEARAELAERPAGVHQRGGVRLEPALGHETVELLGRLGDSTLARSIPAISFSDDRGDPPEHILGGLGRLSARVFHQIALFENVRAF
jgi:hypothetical protein